MEINDNIKKIIGEQIGNIIINRLNADINVFEKLSDKAIYKIIYSLCNYVDSNVDIIYDDIMDIHMSEINTIWESFLSDYKKNYNTSNYIEKNKIILDYRINGIGFYWVDLEKLFCIESMVRMQDCGRVNYGHTTLELRQQFLDRNESYMIVVYNTTTNDINQIKGKKSSKPNKKYWEYLYKLLIDSDYKINEYVPTYKPESDLKMSDLPLILQSTIYLKHPKLKNRII
jgi:hypothetical protein